MNSDYCNISKNGVNSNHSNNKKYNLKHSNNMKYNKIIRRRV